MGYKSGMPRSGAYTLKEFPDDWIELACDKPDCRRRGRLRKDRLLAENGDVALPDLLVTLAACPRKGNMSRPCGAHYVALRSAARLPVTLPKN
jgi:hypothetical protein